MNNKLLEHWEKVANRYETRLDKIPLEDKLVKALEDKSKILADAEISKIVGKALQSLPRDLENYYTLLHEAIYLAVVEALEKIQHEH